MVPIAGIEKRGSAATVRACDSCRRRKRRCVWREGSEACMPCLQLEDRCERTHVRKPRAKPQKRSRISEYENRIQRLESLLEERSAAQPQVHEQPLQPADQSIPLSTWVENLRNEVESLPVQEGPNPGLVAYAAELDEEEPWDSIDAESGLPQPSPQEYGLQSSVVFQPSAEFQEDTALLQDPLFQSTHLKIGPEGVDGPLAPPTECDGLLPPPGLGTSLLKEFLVDFNTALPLYRPQVIVNHLRVCYLGHSDGSEMAWASTYIVFGIAYRSRAMSATGTPQDNEIADYYLARTLGTLSGLLLAPPSLGLVQCLLGLASLVQTSSHPTPHGRFVSTALRVAQSLAYCDDQAEDEGFDQDFEQQRRVFWLAFIKDADESILSNTPATHRRDDIHASSPEENPQDSTGAVTAAEGTWRFNIFSLRVRLALLQTEAIEQVLSIKCRKATPKELSPMAEAVLEALQTWRNHELFKLSTEQLMQLLYQSDIIHVLGLEASYFATVFRLQVCLKLGMNPRLNPFSVDVLDRICSQREHAAYAEAKRFLSILAVVPQGDVGVCWMLKLHVIAALATVLSYHLGSGPGSKLASSDMREYLRIIHMLGTLVQKSQDVELLKARELCMRLYSELENNMRLEWLQDLTADGNEVTPDRLA